MMNEDLRDWTTRAKPKHLEFEGRYVRLEPLDPYKHGHELYVASAVQDAEDKFRYLYEFPPVDEASFTDWVSQVSKSEDPLFFAVVDKATGKVAGRQTVMRIDAPNGSIEVGNIYWGPLISRKPGATEALYLFMKYVFEDLKYRRFEWKCNNNNEPSKKSAVRFGFQQEGLFRQHLVVKGLNRDTAWFSIIDKEWPLLKDAYTAWLDPNNFDKDGQQRLPLAQTIAKVRA